MVYFPPSHQFFPTLRFTPTPSPVLFGPFSLYLCLVCELCCLCYFEVSSDISPTHQKLNSQMQHNNFLKKTSTKQLTHNPHLHPCNQNPSSAASPTHAVLRTSHLWVLDNLPSLPARRCGWFAQILFLFFFILNRNKYISVLCS